MTSTGGEQFTYQTLVCRKVRREKIPLHQVDFYLERNDRLQVTTHRHRVVRRLALHLTR